MNNRYYRLEELLASGLKAWRNSRLQRGVAVALLGMFVLAGVMAVAHPLYASATLWWWIIILCLSAAWFLLVWKYLVQPLRRRPDLRRIARHLEELHPDLEDRLATAVEFGKSGASPQANSLLYRLIEDAIEHTATIDADRDLRIPLRSLWRALAAASIMLLVFALFRQPSFFTSRLQNYFVTPEAPAKLVTELQVSPGDARVPLGETVTITAQSPEQTITDAAIYIETRDGAWSPATMNPATELGSFYYELYEVRDTLRYYVRAAEEISEIYTLTPVAAPAIRGFRVTYNYPAEIGREPHTVEGSGDVYAPAGTSVQIDLLASQALAKAEWRLGDGPFKSMSMIADTIARLSFGIEKDTYYVPRLFNDEGMSNSEVEYFVHLIPDDAPQVTMLKPGRDLRPSMLEEVAVEVRVVEDFGLKELTLVYSQNSQPPVRLNLLPHAKTAQRGETVQREFTAATMLFLEELQVRPGDFISYFIEASDAHQQVSSDLYFLEVRPFEEEFYQPLSQGNAPNGGGSGSLAISQKQIITATWNLDRNRSAYSTEDLAQSSAALHASQLALQQSIEGMAQNLALRGSFTGEQSESANMIDNLGKAAESMARALPLLEHVRLTEALAPEREAYHFLLKVDAEIRRRELTQGSSASGSFAQLQNRDELAELFRDELDKIRSKYETLQNNQQQQVDSNLNKAQEKVRELAQRQERLVELNRQMAREKDDRQNRRQLERLQREQEQLNRDIQNLRRQMQQTNAASAANSSSYQQLLEDLKNTSTDMQRAMDNLRRGNTGTAAADGSRALERLQRMEDELGQRQLDSMRERLTRLRDQSDRLATAQAQLRERLQNAGVGAPGDTAAWHEQQSQLAQDAAGFAEELQRARQAAAKESNQSKVARGLEEASSQLQRRQAPSRMNRAAQAIRNGDFNTATREQQESAKAIREAEEKIKQSLAELSETPAERLDLALHETQQLRREMENALQQQQRGNSQQGEQPSGQSPSAQQRAGERGGSPGGSGESDESLRPEEREWWNQELWSGLRQLESLRPFLEGDTALVNEYDRALQQYRGVVRTFRGGSLQRLQEIEQALIDPVRKLEAELATRLAVLQHQKQLLTVTDERVPPQYREMVDIYFERLARSKK